MLTDHLRKRPWSRRARSGWCIAKRVFQVHGADASGRVVFCKRLVQSKLLAFFVVQPQCMVALEVCGGSHHWGREIGKLGHTVWLIPPAYVKLYVKWQGSVHGRGVISLPVRVWSGVAIGSAV